MAKPRWQIVAGKKIIKFRSDNNITHCSCCGLRLFDTCHHFLCEKCWGVKHTKPLEWAHYHRETHEKYYKNNVMK